MNKINAAKRELLLGLGTNGIAYNDTQKVFQRKRCKVAAAVIRELVKEGDIKLAATLAAVWTRNHDYDSLSHKQRWTLMYHQGISAGCQGRIGIDGTYYEA